MTHLGCVLICVIAKKYARHALEACKAEVLEFYYKTFLNLT